VATAATTFAAAKAAIETMRRLRRLMPPVRAVRIGELNAYEIVKTVTSCPAATRPTDRSSAKLGSNGAIMNPSVPIAKVPRAIQ
jgi:hypothetical protein